MPIFVYKGLDQAGKLLRGSFEADSIKSARSQISNRGIFLQELKAKNQDQPSNMSFILKKVSVKQVSVFTRLLSSLLKSNIPLVESLDAIAQQIDDPYFATSITNIKNQVNEGKPFHLSLKEYPHIFDTIYSSLCESGEASGNLDEILERLAHLMEKRSIIRSKVISALIYPAILLFVTVSIMIVLCAYVVPTVTELFENQEQLPWMTKITIGFSEFLINYWLSLIIGVFLTGFFFIRWKQTPKGKYMWDKIMLKIPVLGRLIRAADISLFSRTLSTLMHGGIPVLQSMDIVKNIVKNELIREAIAVARQNIKEGEPITDPLKRSGQFPPVVLQMIRIGEKTGELEMMLTEISENYDRQVDVEVTAFTSVLGPVMLIFMACIIGFVLVSIMLPMLGAFGDLA